MTDRPPSELTRVRRAPQRGAYDRASIDAVLDAGLVAHVAYVLDGRPVVTPTLYWREGDRIYWHGSSASRMLRRTQGAEVSIAVTHLDGLVLARSGFHCSVNYRSAMLFGRANLVPEDEKAARLDAFVDGVVDGRATAMRRPTIQELKATTVLWMPIEEASAKVRTGAPVDDEEDYALPVWAGVVPLRMVAGEPEPDPRLHDGTPVPDAVYRFVERWR